jgi:hypothetical protein
MGVLVGMSQGAYRRVLQFLVLSPLMKRASLACLEFEPLSSLDLYLFEALGTCLSESQSHEHLHGSI